MPLSPDAGRSDRGLRSTPFWNVNVPVGEQTTHCPGFLRYALRNEKDQAILGTPDAVYRRQTWEEVQGFVRDHRIDRFQRVPSALRLYRQYCSTLVREYGSVASFVVEERLGWSDLAPSGPPFSNAGDYKVLHNDWPYGVDERIVHLVVWCKFELPADPASEIGHLSPDTQQAIERFVHDVFVARCGESNVVWFKNGTSLKSVHAVEHFHVMLFDPDADFVRRITGGDVALAQKLRHRA